VRSLPGHYNGLRAIHHCCDDLQQPQGLPGHLLAKNIWFRFSWVFQEHSSSAVSSATVWIHPEAITVISSPLQTEVSQHAESNAYPFTGAPRCDISRRCAIFSIWPYALRAFLSFWLFSLLRICQPNAPVLSGARVLVASSGTTHFVLTDLRL
jgi:hypothetical protein